MAKYTVLVMHNGGIGRVDKVKPLEAQNLPEILEEVTNFCKGDLDFFKAVVYEQVGNGNEYKIITESFDGKVFYVKGPSRPYRIEGPSDLRQWKTVVRNTKEVNGETVESFEFPHFIPR